MEYLDFELRLEPLGEGRYHARVLGSPAGEEACEVVSLPPLGHDGDLERLGRAVQRSGISRSAAGPSREPASPRTIAQRIGNDLFQALFTGRVGERFAASCGYASSGAGRVLRVRLRYPLSDREMAPAVALPWEYMARGRDFLGLDPAFSVVRHPEVARTTRLPPFRPPLRIALLSASPARLPPVAVLQETDRILAAWQHRSEVVVETLERRSAAALHSQLRDGKFHVLHFMGHGRFNRRDGRGAIVLEDERGNADFVDGETLADLLTGLPRLRLVVLNACQTAAIGTEDPRDPCLGVAPALIQAGLPAVIAMQFRISDPAALAFGAALYERLARREPLDAAVTAGRLAVYNARRRSLEWGTPVLFLRSRDGRLFQQARRDAPRTARFQPADKAAARQGPAGLEGRHGLPSRPFRRLIGRTAPLGQIRMDLERDGGSLLVAIHGMGGIGKTALAYQIARSASPDRFDHVVWLAAPRPKKPMAAREGDFAPLTLSRILDEIAIRLRAPSVLAAMGEAREEALRDRLTRSRTLIVLDNLETAGTPQAEIASRLLELLARTPSRALLTSRRRFGELLLDPVLQVPLAGLDLPASLRFLRMEARARDIVQVRDAARQVLEKIARDTGGSPLAMKLVVGQLHHEPLPVVLERLRQAGPLGDGQDEDEYQGFYTHLFWPSWMLLDEEARRLLLLLAQYSPTSGASRSRLLRASRMDERGFDRARQRIWTLSLLEDSRPTRGLKDIVYRLHPLTCYFVRSQFGDRVDGSGHA